MKLATEHHVRYMFVVVRMKVAAQFVCSFRLGQWMSAL